MIRSPGFGSNTRYSSSFHDWFPYDNTCLASNINLLTHYAKGTLLFFFIFLRAAYKITNSEPSLTVLVAITHMLYLVLEKGFPIFKQIRIHFT